MELAESSVLVICNNPALGAQACSLAELLRVPVLYEVLPQSLTEPEFAVVFDQQGLALQQTGRKAPGPIQVDFSGGAVDHRRKFGGGKGQMIAKAVGIKSNVYPQILDVTAGLGRDGFVLASLGCCVSLCERSPLVHALLADGLYRAEERGQEEGDIELRQILSRMNLLASDSIDYLRQLPDEPSIDVIYMDPMFPERQKRADVKKEMRAFHSVVGGDEDADQLLALALAKARYRVVVKRPRKAPSLSGPAVSYQLEGKSSRYDIYTKQKLPDKLPLV